MQAQWLTKHGKEALTKGFILDAGFSTDLQKKLKVTGLEVRELAYVTPWQSGMIPPEYFSRLCNEVTMDELLNALDSGLTEDDLPFEIKDSKDLYALFYDYEIRGFYTLAY